MCLALFVNPACLYNTTNVIRLTSVPLLRRREVCSLLTTVRGQYVEPPTDLSLMQKAPCRLLRYFGRISCNAQLP
jgi:hypothetical protein